MAIVQISQLQVRRGLDQDLPQLASGELAWSIDKRKVYIGNGTLGEGAPALGHTEILTEFSILNFTNSLTSNISALAGNVTILHGNIVTINSQISALQTGSTTSNVATLAGGITGLVQGIVANNGVISYSLQQGTAQRTGQIRFAYSNSTVTYDEEYSQDASTTIAFNMTANASYSSFNYNTIGTGTITTLQYQIKSLI
jgi:hypothetical protein